MLIGTFFCGGGKGTIYCTCHSFTAVPILWIDPGKSSNLGTPIVSKEKSDILPSLVVVIQMSTARDCPRLLLYVTK